uniref:Secreted protein n=1 Tax=Picea sitchensis TaxID=3332 RepID=B8LQN3_PICSI|nr:unknown [Picea sitchensis]
MVLRELLCAILLWNYRSSFCVFFAGWRSENYFVQYWCGRLEGREVDQRGATTRLAMNILNVYMHNDN